MWGGVNVAVEDVMGMKTNAMLVELRNRKDVSGFKKWCRVFVGMFSKNHSNKSFVNQGGLF